MNEFAIGLCSLPLDSFGTVFLSLLGRLTLFSSLCHQLVSGWRSWKWRGWFAAVLRRAELGKTNGQRQQTSKWGTESRKAEDWEGWSSSCKVQEKGWLRKCGCVSG